MTVRLVKNTMTPSLKAIEKRLSKIPQQAYNFFVKTTPKDTGQARRRTNLRGNVIDANYQYATHLDQGSSQQARRGMTGPTTDYVTRLIRQGVKK